MHSKYILFVTLVSTVVLLLFANTAFGDVLRHKEAESKPNTAYGNKVFDVPATPTGVNPNAWKYLSAGSVSYSYTIDEDEKINSVVARARGGDGTTSGVDFTLVVDGVAKNTKTFGGTGSGKTYADRPWAVAIPPGNHTLSFKADNLQGNDSLLVDWIELRGTTQPPDSDGDTVADSADNCVSTPNTDQTDMDSDGRGDVCDSDKDGDGIDNTTDNCPEFANPEQVDTDNDGVGDHCDSTPGDCSAEYTPTKNREFINSGPELETALSANTMPTIFCFKFTGSYSPQNTLRLDVGDELIGVIGNLKHNGPATYPADVPTKITNDNGLSIVIAGANDVRLRWLDVSGGIGRYVGGTPLPCDKPATGAIGCPIGGTGVNIAASKDATNMLVENVVSHDAENTGINGGVELVDSELYNNGSNMDFNRYSSAGIKANEEYEVYGSYVHDNFTHGLWCDQGCYRRGDSQGLILRDNLIANNARYGFRWEFSPMAEPGVHSPTPTALVENNYFLGNGETAITIRDAQNATVRGNIFGGITLGGTSYRHNKWNQTGDSVAVNASGGGERTDLYNTVIENNTLNGEKLVGCDLPDDIVACQNNME